MNNMRDFKHIGNYITDLFVFRPQNTVLLSWFVMISLAVFILSKTAQESVTVA